MLIVLLGITAIITYQFRPNSSGSSQAKKKKSLFGLIGSVKSTLQQLQDKDRKLMTKCWNCFKEVQFSDKVCAYCGKSQG